jgi:hypothetical protein
MFIAVIVLGFSLIIVAAKILALRSTSIRIRSIWFWVFSAGIASGFAIDRIRYEIGLSDAVVYACASVLCIFFAAVHRNTIVEFGNITRNGLDVDQKIIFRVCNLIICYERNNQN